MRVLLTLALVCIGCAGAPRPLVTPAGDPPTDATPAEPAPTPIARAEPVADDALATQRQATRDLLAWLADHPDLRIEGADPSALAPRAVIESLQLQPLGDRCVTGATTCCRLGERWRCTDPAIATALGSIRVATMQFFDDAISFESEHFVTTTPDLSHYEEGTVVLHWLAADGDALIHAGSIELGSVSFSEEWQPPRDPSDTERRGVESDDVRLEWTYAIHGARCVGFLAVSQRAVRVHEGRSQTELIELSLAAAPDRLPRLAYRAGGAEGDETLWTREGVVDRRGLWRLEPEGWQRVDRCDAP